MPGHAVETLARELMVAVATGRPIAVPPSARPEGLDLPTAYAVEASVARLRRAAGHETVGRKVGYASKAAWRLFKLDTLVWGHMYDDTVRAAAGNRAVHSLAGRLAPRLEPEIVFRLKAPLEPGVADAAAVLDAVEWMALGFEINDCPFPDWQITPVDFVAALGLHTALIVGDPQPIAAATADALAADLGRFTLALLRDGELVEQGKGRNALRSPALCLAELASAVVRGPEPEPLAPGELVSTGTLTAPQPVAAGQRWAARVEGLGLGELTVEFSDDRTTTTTSHEQRV